MGSLDMTIPERGSLLGNFNMRMRKINLEHANLNTRLALRGPEPRGSLESGSVTSSQAFAQAAEAIQGRKVDNIISLMDSVLRRNKEEEEDDVLFGGSCSDAVSEDIFASHPALPGNYRY